MTLKAFLSEPINSVTRERIFFNRLYYDLKLAAARRGYALTVFEPEVDRESYDIVLDDGDVERRFQLKTRMADSKTKTWEVTRRFIRPHDLYGDRLNLAPADCGFGGGIVLIEINADKPEPTVSYSYTDWFIVQALEMRLWSEAVMPPKKKGPAPDLRQATALKALKAIYQGSARDSVWLERRLFVRANSADSLLALMGFHSETDCYLPNDKVLGCIEAGFSADDTRNPVSGLSLETIRWAQTAAEDIFGLLDEPELALFIAPPRQPPGGGDHSLR